MASAPPKRSWKNVAMGLQRPTTYLHVEPPPQYLGFPPREEFMLQCIGEVFKRKYPLNSNNLTVQAFIDKWKPWNYEWIQNIGTFIVLTFEHNMLTNMGKPENPDRQRLESDIQWISQELNCNVVFYLGHIEECPAYVETTYKKILEKTIPSKLPTVFLIIGCYGTDIAYDLNTHPRNKFFHDRNVAFFGFEDFMHVHAGEIYSCKKLHYGAPSLECRYDEDMDDLNALLEGDKKPEDIGTFDTENPLYKCCSSRLERIYKKFIEELYERETTRYPKEKLAAKFRAFATTGNRKLLTREYTMVQAKDGVACKKGTCKIPNPFTKEETIALEFNERNSLYALYRELSSYITYNENPDLSVTEQIDRFWRRIQNLKGRERGIFNFVYEPGLPPILFMIFESPYISSYTDSIFKILSFIIQKYGKDINFEMRTPNNNNLLEVIQIKNRFNKEQEYYIHKLIYNALSTQESQEKLFLNLGKKNGCVLLKNKYLNPLILEFYIQTFGEKLKSLEYIKKSSHLKGTLLHRVMEEYIYPMDTSNTSSRLMKCVHGLLALGFDPNKRLEVIPEEREKFLDVLHYSGLKEESCLLKPFQVFLKLYNPPYYEEMFDLFIRYGMTNEDRFLNTELEKWRSMIENTPQGKKQMHRHYLFYKSVEEYLYYASREYSHYEEYNNSYNMVGGMPRWRNDYSYNNYSNNNNDDYRFWYYKLTTLEKREVDAVNKFYSEFFENKLLEIAGGILTHFRYLNYVYDTPRKQHKFDKEKIMPTITMYENALRFRKAYGKHGSKIRKTRKGNKNRINKTLKNNLANINFQMNGKKIIGDLVGTILELAKKPQFTKPEKAHYKSRPLQIKEDKETTDKDKYDLLSNLLNEMNEILKTRV